MQDQPIGDDLQEGLHCEDDEEHVLHLLLKEGGHMVEVRGWHRTPFSWATTTHPGVSTPFPGEQGTVEVGTPPSAQHPSLHPLYWGAQGTLALRTPPSTHQRPILWEDKQWNSGPPLNPAPPFLGGTRDIGIENPPTRWSPSFPAPPFRGGVEQGRVELGHSPPTLPSIPLSQSS